MKLTFISTKRKYSHRLPDRPFRRRIQQLGENRCQLFIYIPRGLTDLYGFESGGYDVLLYARNDGILITNTPQDYYLLEEEEEANSITTYD